MGSESRAEIVSLCQVIGCRGSVSAGQSGICVQGLEGMQTNM